MAAVSRASWHWRGLSLVSAEIARYPAIVEDRQADFAAKEDHGSLAAHIRTLTHDMRIALAEGDEDIDVKMKKRLVTFTSGEAYPEKWGFAW